MIGVVIVRTMADNDVSLPFTNETNESFAIFKRGQEFAVVDVEDLSGDAEEFGDALDFGRAAQGQRTAGLAPVADVAVGGVDKFDRVAAGCPHGADSATSEFAVVGMGVEDDDAEWFGFHGLRVFGRRKFSKTFCLFSAVGGSLIVRQDDGQPKITNRLRAERLGRVFSRTGGLLLRLGLFHGGSAGRR